MASSTNAQIVLSSGANFFVRWTTAQAVSTDLHVNKLGIPIDTDSPDLLVTQNSVIVDVLAGSSSPTGTVQLLEDQQPTPFFLNVAAYLPTNTGRKPPMIPLRAGHSYRFRTLTAMSAGD